MRNPLLEAHLLPPFDQIQTAHMLPAIKTLIETNLHQVEQLLDTTTPYSWATLIEPLEKLDLKLGNAWSPVSHMHSVVDSSALREAYDACLPILTQYSTEMGQNRKLFQAYQTIKKIIGNR